MPGSNEEDVPSSIPGGSDDDVASSLPGNRGGRVLIINPLAIQELSNSGAFDPSITISPPSPSDSQSTGQSTPNRDELIRSAIKFDQSKYRVYIDEDREIVLADKKKITTLAKLYPNVGFKWDASSRNYYGQILGEMTSQDLRTAASTIPSSALSGAVAATARAVIATMFTAAMVSAVATAGATAVIAAAGGLLSWLITKAIQWREDAEPSPIDQNMDLLEKVYQYPTTRPGRFIHLVMQQAPFVVQAVSWYKMYDFIDRTKLSGVGVEMVVFKMRKGDDKIVNWVAGDYTINLGILNIKPFYDELGASVADYIRRCCVSENIPVRFGEGDFPDYMREKVEPKFEMPQDLATLRRDWERITSRESSEPVEHVDLDDPATEKRRYYPLLATGVRIRRPRPPTEF